MEFSRLVATLVFLVAGIVGAQQPDLLDPKSLSFNLGDIEAALGDFHGNLSDEAPTGNNGSSVTWYMGSEQNITWSVTWNKSVDIILCSRRQDQSWWDNHTIEANYTGDYMPWNVSLDGMPTDTPPAIEDGEFFFLMRETDGPFLIQSQNITIMDMADDDTTTTTTTTMSSTSTSSSSTSPSTSTSFSSTTPPATTSQPNIPGPSPAQTTTDVPTPNPALDLNKQAMPARLSTGAIVGIAIGATLLAALLLLACACCLCIRSRRQRKETPASTAENGGARSTGPSMDGASVAAPAFAAAAAAMAASKSRASSDSGDSGYHSSGMHSPINSPLNNNSAPTWFASRRRSSISSIPISPGSLSSKPSQDTLRPQSSVSNVSRDSDEDSEMDPSADPNLPDFEFPTPPSSAAIVPASTAERARTYNALRESFAARRASTNLLATQIPSGNIPWPLTPDTPATLGTLGGRSEGGSAVETGTATVVMFSASRGARVG